MKFSNKFGTAILKWHSHLDYVRFELPIRVLFAALRGQAKMAHPTNSKGAQQFESSFGRIAIYDRDAVTINWAF